MNPNRRTRGVRRRVLASALALSTLILLLAAGCDRTRPYVPPGAESAGGGAAPATPGGGGAAASKAQAPVKTAGGWLFTLDAPQAASVALAGSFNDWSTTADPLKKGENGVWSIVKSLDPGDYQYKFVVNGSEWKPDPDNPQSSDDGYGGKNSVLKVS